MVNYHNPGPDDATDGSSNHYNRDHSDYNGHCFVNNFDDGLLLCTINGTYPHFIDFEHFTVRGKRTDGHHFQEHI